MDSSTLVGVVIALSLDGTESTSSFTGTSITCTVGSTAVDSHHERTVAPGLCHPLARAGLLRKNLAVDPTDTVVEWPRHMTSTLQHLVARRSDGELALPA